MNPLNTLRMIGLWPVEAEAVLQPRWLLPLEFVAPAHVETDGPEYVDPDSGLAYDMELASMLTVVTATMGSWGH
jgi:hypothetical protein